MGETKNLIKLAYLEVPTVVAQIECVAERLAAQEFPVSVHGAKGIIVAHVIESTLARFARDLRRGMVSVAALKRYDEQYKRYPKSPPKLLKGGFGGAEEKGMFISENSLTAIDAAGEQIAGMEGAPNVRIGKAWAKKKIIAFSLSYACDTE